MVSMFIVSEFKVSLSCLSLTASGPGEQPFRINLMVVTCHNNEKILRKDPALCNTCMLFFLSLMTLFILLVHILYCLLFLYSMVDC